jgi:hypothetical protein
MGEIRIAYVYKILVRKYARKRLLERLRCGWGIILKWILKACSSG